MCHLFVAFRTLTNEAKRRLFQAWICRPRCNQLRQSSRQLPGLRRPCVDQNSPAEANMAGRGNPPHCQPFCFGTTTASSPQAEKSKNAYFFFVEGRLLICVET